MVKKKLTLIERYRRLKRIIRYLHKRGTLFRSKPPKPPAPFIPSKPKKKKIWRPWRKIRYLAKRGSLFRKKRKVIPENVQVLNLQKHRKRSRYDLYLAYRRLRFLINTGRLFKSRKDSLTNLPVKKNKRRIVRKIRYLLYRRSLFKIQYDPLKKFWKDYFRMVLKPDYLKIIINSTLLFLLAYLIVFAIVNFSASFAALTFEIKSKIYYYNIVYLIRGKDWTVDAIKVVYSSGPFICLIISMILLIFYFNIAEETWFVRILFFWIFCHAFIHFFGELLIGTILMKGFGVSIVYIFRVEYKKLLIILVSSFILILSGLLLTKQALFSANTYFNMLTTRNRSYFLHSQFLIPSILGFLIIILLKIPELTEFDFLVNLTMFFIILPLIVRGTTMKDMYFDPEIRKIRIRWIYFLIVVGALFLFRVGLGYGLYVGSRFTE